MEIYHRTQKYTQNLQLEVAPLTTPKSQKYENIPKNPEIFQNSDVSLLGPLPVYLGGPYRLPLVKGTRYE